MKAWIEYRRRALGDHEGDAPEHERDDRDRQRVGDDEVARLAKTLVAAVSHDLRAPLARIRASSSTLSDTELDITPETRQRLAQLIDVQADRLATLVQNLLDMSRIQAGVLEPRRSVASLSELVAGVASELGTSLRAHAVRVEMADDLPPIDVDVVLISRVLSNLLENAIRHGPRGTAITISAARVRDDTIELSVTDQGPGVRLDRRNEVFGLFVRREDDAGAGFGLAIAKTFVEAHGQRIRAEDAPGGGARFCVTLPVAASIPEETRIAEGSHH